MQGQDNAKLREFVDASKSKGASDEFLAALLTRGGWPAEDVYGALGTYWQTITGIAVPERKGTGESARDAFLYLLSFATLATWTTALGGMVFDFINHWLPDPVSRSSVFNLRTALTWEMARIAVAFPIFLLVTRFTLREAMNFPDRLQSGVRKWLTYIALLGTAGTMICDLIWFLNYLLNGEITPRFLLKASTVLVICGAIFVYYLDSLQWSKATNVARTRFRNIAFGAVSTVAVVATFCAGLVLAGTPSEQRRVEADDRRVQDLRNLAFAIKAWHDHRLTAGQSAEIPGNLNDLVDGRQLTGPQIRDPETRVLYEYHPRVNLRYELCANFDSTEEDSRDLLPHSPFWHYGAGKTCFVLNASEAVPL